MSQKALSPRTVTMLFVAGAFLIFVIGSRTPRDLVGNLPMLLILVAIPIAGYALLRWKGMVPSE